MGSSLWRSALTAAVFVTLAASPVLAEQTVTPAALRVVRDAHTGRLRAPTPEELQRMLAREAAARSARRSAPGVFAKASAPETTVRRHANGMKSAVLGPEYLVAVKARYDANGRLVVTHDRGVDSGVAPVASNPTE